MTLQPPLVAPAPGLDLVQGQAEGRVGVGALAMALQHLAGIEPDGAIDLEVETILGDHDVGSAAAVKILADGGGDVVRDPRTQGLPDVDVLAGDLNLHGHYNAPVGQRCQANPGVLPSL